MVNIRKLIHKIKIKPKNLIPENDKNYTMATDLKRNKTARNNPPDNPCKNLEYRLKKRYKYNQL